DLGVARGHGHGGVDVTAVQHGHVQALLRVEALVLRHEVAGELRLREPLRLEVDGDQLLSHPHGQEHEQREHGQRTAFHPLPPGCLTVWSIWPVTRGPRAVFTWS